MYRTGIHLVQKSFGSLWPLYDKVHGCLFAGILPTATAKMVDKSRINKTYSLMKEYVSILSLSLSSKLSSQLLTPKLETNLRTSGSESLGESPIMVKLEAAVPGPRQNRSSRTKPCAGPGRE